MNKVRKMKVHEVSGSDSQFIPKGDSRQQRVRTGPGNIMRSGKCVMDIVSMAIEPEEKITLVGQVPARSVFVMEMNP